MGAFLFIKYLKISTQWYTVILGWHMKKIKIYIFVIISIAILLLVIFKVNNKEDLYVGLVTDLSGKNSNLGVLARNGLLLAVEEINNSGGIRGRQLELVIKDHGGSKDLCYENTKELIELGVNVIISPILSGMASSVIEGASGSDVLIFGPTVSTDDLSGIDDNFLRVSGPSSTQGKYLGNAALKNSNKKVAIIIDKKNSSYTLGVAKRFKQNYDNPTTDIIFSDKSEFPGIIKKLEEIKPDGIVFIANGLDSAEIIQLYGKNNILPNLYGSSWVKASDVHKYGGKTVEGMIIADTLVHPQPLPSEQVFIDNYRSSFNSEPNSIAIYFYESLILYCKGIELAESFSSEEVKMAILGIKIINGITEDYYLDEFGDGVRTLQLSVIKDGQYEFLK